jgi:hypothetical protein
MTEAIWPSDKIIVFENRQYETEFYFVTYQPYDLDGFLNWQSFRFLTCQM